jgi:phage baseplate assembly protein W
LARTVFTYQPIPAGRTALGIKLPFNKGVVGGRSPFQNYSSGSLDGAGVFESSYDTVEQAVSNLKSLLLTRTGERFMQPDLGTDIFNALFENITQDLEDYLENNIKEKIAFWLPYIGVTDLRLFENIDKGSYLIQLSVVINPQGANRVINILAGNENISIIEDNTPVTDSQGNLIAGPVGQLTAVGNFNGGSITGGTPLAGVDPNSVSFSY